MGIDLHDRAVSDSQKIHNNNLGAGGFSVDMEFEDLVTPIPNKLTIKALYNDVAIQIDPEQGSPVQGSQLSISFHQSDLTIWDGLADLQRWKISFTNGAGQIIKAEIDYPWPNRSFGDVVCLCKIISGHVATT